jgi:hypothetical protein
MEAGFLHLGMRRRRSGLNILEMEERRRNKRQVRSVVLLLIGEGDKIYCSMIMAKCKVIGRGVEG